MKHYSLLRRMIAVVIWGVCQAPASAQDAGRGKMFYEVCASCHKISEVSTEYGPSLLGVVGRKAAGATDFSYSKAFRRAAFIWNEERLDAYLTDPQSAMPGSRMPFSGVPDQSEREDLIAYLKTLK